MTKKVCGAPTIFLEDGVSTIKYWQMLQDMFDRVYRQIDVSGGNFVPSPRRFEI